MLRRIVESRRISVTPGRMVAVHLASNLRSRQRGVSLTDEAGILHMYSLSWKTFGDSLYYQAKSMYPARIDTTSGQQVLRAVLNILFMNANSEIRTPAHNPFLVLVHKFAFW